MIFYDLATTVEVVNADAADSLDKTISTIATSDKRSLVWSSQTTGNEGRGVIPSGFLVSISIEFF